MSRFFPSIDKADEDGFLCWSPEINFHLIKDAYENGIFPWPQREEEVLWFTPPERGLIILENMKVPRSFRKWEKRFSAEYSFSYDQDFPQIIRECRDAIRPGQQGSWITEDIIATYETCFSLGYIHCLGVYRKQKLVAGIYGVYCGNYFSAESMFYKENNTSKLALYQLLKRLKIMGHTWVDVQMITPVTKQFGGVYVSRSEFMKFLIEARQKKIPWQSQGI